MLPEHRQNSRGLQCDPDTLNMNHGKCVGKVQDVSAFACRLFEVCLASFSQSTHCTSTQDSFVKDCPYVCTFTFMASQCNIGKQSGPFMLYTRFSLEHARPMRSAVGI